MRKIALVAAALAMSFPALAQQQTQTSQQLRQDIAQANQRFEQAFKDRLLHPNRTPAEAEASRKKHGIVYRDPRR